MVKLYMIVLFVVVLLFSFWDRRANRTWESSVPEEKRDILPLFRIHIYGLGKKSVFSNEVSLGI